MVCWFDWFLCLWRAFFHFSPLMVVCFPSRGGVNYVVVGGLSNGGLTGKISQRKSREKKKTSRNINRFLSLLPGAMAIVCARDIVARLTCCEHDFSDDFIFGYYRSHVNSLPMGIWWGICRLTVMSPLKLTSTDDWSASQPTRLCFECSDGTTVGTHKLMQFVRWEPRTTKQQNNQNLPTTKHETTKII